MTEETTTEQLAEIDRDMADIERQVAELVEEAQKADYKTQELPEYTPPDGWRVVRFGEQLLPGDVWVSHDGTEHRSSILHWDASAVSGGRCIRPIEPQPEPQPAEYTPPEGWRVLAVGEALREGDMTVRKDGYSYSTERVGGWVGANQRYIRPIEPQPQPKPESHAAAIEELRSEVSYVQNLLGTERRKVAQLEELVASLRTINEAQEKAFEAAGKQNDALRLQVENRQQEYERQKARIEFLETLNAGNGAAIDDYRAKVQHLQGLVGTALQSFGVAATEHDSLSTQLEAVKAELVTQAETSRRLQIELDAAQQVPADSPELRQLRADLEQVTLGRDTYRDAHDLLLNDANTAHERTKAMTVEAIAEWLEPIRLVDSPNLANETLQHLPQIMRSLVGLDSPEDVD